MKNMVLNKLGLTVPAPKQPEQLTKIGALAQAPDRTKADSPGPQAEQGKGESKTFIDTYFTKAGETQIIYNGDRQWARISLMLETAGPVSVGTAQNLTPVLSGKGQLLPTGVERQFTIGKGTRLYVAATGVNRIKRVIEPLPWLEQITGLVSGMVGSLGMLLRRGGK